MKFPMFTKALQKCDTVLRPYNIFLTDILTSKDKSIFDNNMILLLALVGLQVKKKKPFKNFV